MEFSFAGSSRIHERTRWSRKVLPSCSSSSFGGFRGTADARFQSLFPLPPCLPPDRLLTGHSKGLDAVAWLPASTRLVTASHDKTIKIWNESKSTCDRTLHPGHQGGVYALAVASEGSLICSGGAGASHNVCILDVNSPHAVKHLEGQTQDVYDVFFMQKGSSICSSCKDGSIRVHDISSGCLTTTLDCLGEVVHSSAQQPVATVGPGGKGGGGDLIASACQGAFVNFSDPRAGRSVGRLPAPHGSRGVKEVIFSDSNHILTSGEDCLAKMFDLRTCISSFSSSVKPSASASTSKSGYFSPRASLGASVRDDCLCVFAGHTSSINRLALSPDKTFLASSCDDGAVRIWAMGFEQTCQKLPNETEDSPQKN
eukprot:GHVT01049179.1.p1 GENE.GHVT01049179.1~~GHVT01049179.1.p1  ORF type:complete len:370 (+),score=43.57 GHVT01049179.1:922-2031(+)